MHASERGHEASAPVRRVAHLPPPARLRAPASGRCSCSACSARRCSPPAWCCFTGFAKAFGDGTFENRDPHTIVWLPLALIGLFVLRGLGDFTQTYCMGYVGRHIVKRLRAQIFERMMQLPIGYYDRNSSSVLLSRLTYNTEQVGQAATDSVVGHACAKR